MKSKICIDELNDLYYICSLLDIPYNEVIYVLNVKKYINMFCK